MEKMVLIENQVFSVLGPYYSLNHFSIFAAMEFFELIRKGETATIEKLIAADKSLLNARDPRGFTPLILSTYNEHYELAEKLLHAGAEVNALDAAGNTALMGVSFKGYINIAKLLLDHGANVNVQNSNGATALIYSATFGQTAIAKMLLENGADKTLKDGRGNTAYMHAKFQGVPGLPELLQ